MTREVTEMEPGTGTAVGFLMAALLIAVLVIAMIADDNDTAGNNVYPQVAKTISQP